MNQNRIEPAAIRKGSQKTDNDELRPFERNNLGVGLGKRKTDLSRIC